MNELERLTKIEDDAKRAARLLGRSKEDERDKLERAAKAVINAQMAETLAASMLAAMKVNLESSWKRGEIFKKLFD